MSRVIKSVLLVSAGFFSATLSASDFTFEWDWMLSAETVQQRETAFSPITDNEHQESFNGLLDVQIGYQDWNAVVALKGNDLYYHSSLEYQDKSAEAELIISELFWQSSVDIANTSLDLQLGKVRVDWGVGYGYRPLDIFTPYRRNPVGIQVEEGAGVASVSYFDNQGEWSLIYTDSSWTQQQGNELEEQSEQQGIGIRRYALMGDTEYQWVAYYDDVRQGLVGVSVVTVLDAAWEFHGSAVYQLKYLSYQQPSITLYPVTLKKEENAYQALVGFTWANAVGNSIVLEYWYDSRAWSKSDWNNAFIVATPSYQQGFNQANMVQHNMMFHWSLDPNAWSTWQWSQNISWLSQFTPTFDVLYSPEDNGVIATQWLNYLLHDSGDSSIEMELAARFLTGKSDSAYANLPDKHMILLNLKGRF
ncbi:MULTISPECIES: hypothetical protein [unclassified Aliivibrio]|uniref:hypothetical protein n=1 Tax=unclassified Aliivibrio TaxID=2645654 RepID=UPI00080DBD33|nr:MULTISPECIES: hypothetical protein [unclassified Aliivibrio]OCH13748.1 hypothetical protein A6E05_05425 [Aliivibrio sp. 1S165]OCH23795.1 hypothetical protein A6E03_09135 [Aliivibrio sp. 1S128]OCH31610.1 hypothetical protein A6E06_03010 [Aliivibrio sp. 1S175]